MDRKRQTSRHPSPPGRSSARAAAAARLYEAFTSGSALRRYDSGQTVRSAGRTPRARASAANRVVHSRRFPWLSGSAVALGHTNQEVAETLVLSVRTVETHRAHVMQKLRISSRAELVRYALEHGLLDTA